jgi:hypothetical protein
MIRENWQQEMADFQQRQKAFEEEQKKFAEKVVQWNYEKQMSHMTS